MYRIMTKARLTNTEVHRLVTKCDKIKSEIKQLPDASMSNTIMRYRNSVSHMIFHL